VSREKYPAQTQVANHKRQAEAASTPPQELPPIQSRIAGYSMRSGPPTTQTAKGSPGFNPGLPKEAREGGNNQGRRCKVPFRREQSRKSRKTWKRVELMYQWPLCCSPKLHITSQKMPVRLKPSKKYKPFRISRLQLLCGNFRTVFRQSLKYPCNHSEYEYLLLEYSYALLEFLFSFWSSIAFSLLSRAL